jgi:SAM-dependent methyltransferase
VLAEAGYTVTALDADPGLLTAVRDRAKDRPVHAIEADLMAFRQHVSGPLDAVLCMGDTLTHLPDRAAVEALAQHVAGALGPGGVFCATFRDYTKALEGDARFIPVQRDENRTLTAFLEYGPDVVTVHDLLHERGEDGWTLRVSSYPKLRLDPAWVAALFVEQGLSVDRGSGSGGMVRLTVRAV